MNATTYLSTPKIHKIILDNCQILKKNDFLVKLRSDKQRHFYHTLSSWPQGKLCFVLVGLCQIG